MLTFLKLEIYLHRSICYADLYRLCRPIDEASIMHANRFKYNRQLLL